MQATELSLKYFKFRECDVIPIKFIKCIIEVKLAISGANYKNDKLNKDKFY